MCLFVTLIAPTLDVARLAPVLERRGRAAKPMDNPSVRAVLKSGEHQYLTTSGACDCSTVLAAETSSPEETTERAVRAAARMRRKGWSEARIERALADSNRRPEPSRDPLVSTEDGRDSLALWDLVLHDLGEELGLRSAGLFVRMYSGAIATERFEARRRESPHPAKRFETLGSMQLDEVTIFGLR